jgi:hypothetical protein
MQWPSVSRGLLLEELAAPVVAQLILRKGNQKPSCVFCRSRSKNVGAEMPSSLSVSSCSVEEGMPWSSGEAAVKVLPWQLPRQSASSALLDGSTDKVPPECGGCENLASVVLQDQHLHLDNSERMAEVWCRMSTQYRSSSTIRMTPRTCPSILARR